MLKLFLAPGACSLAPHIILEELGEPFEPVQVDLAGGEQNSPAFRSVNPHGKVPALVTEQGVLTENPAVLAYLADRRPELGLLAADPFERARCLSLLAWLSSTLHPAFGRIWRPQALTGETAAHRDISTRATRQVEECLGELDMRLDGAVWLFGDFSVADPYVLVMRRWAARVGLDTAQWPHLVRHGDRVAARPSAERALAREGIRIDG